MSDSAAGAPAQAMEMVPLADRLRWMMVVRLGVVGLPLLAWLVAGDRGRSPAVLVVPGLLLLLTGAVLQRLSRRGRRRAVAAMTVPVTLDAVYLGWALYLTGGVTGPVVYVIALHVLAVTLVGSFRTGIKMAFWHSLVVMSLLEAVTTGVLAQAGVGTQFDKVRFSVFLAVVWVTAVTTAVLAGVNERELRRRRYDEAVLRRLAAALHEAETAVEVAGALLDFTLDAGDAALAAVYCRLVADDDTAPTSMVVRRRQDQAPEVLREIAEPAPGSLVDAVFARGSTMLAAMRGPDAWVDDVLDGAPRVVAVPFGIDGQGTGVLAFKDDAREGSRIQQRRVAVVEQAVAHAATALARVALLEHLQQSALTDGLTGVPNRRAFDLALAREVALAGRTDAVLAVIIIDLDKFKSLNDTYGHLAGDDVLRGVGAALRTSTRQGDLVARYGGEEFVLLLPGATEDDAVATARRVRGVLREVEAPRTITASLGIALRPVHGVTGPDLLAAADAALYVAKESGRDQARVAGREGPVVGGETDGPDDVLPLDPRAVPVPIPVQGGPRTPSRVP